MKAHKTAYELSQSQVSTPPDVIDLFWRLTHARRQGFDTVLDMGAGDCRFATGGNFRHYVGVEIDQRRVETAVIPENGRLLRGCAFRHTGTNYEACIGNPPYVRHNDIESPWKERIFDRVKASLGIRLNQKCNLYLYFMCLGILKTTSNGLLALVIPFEWVSRPSADPIRSFIREKGWSVDVYRFQKPIFSGVLTTASITIIDKRATSGKWSYFDITPRLAIRRRENVADDPKGALAYSNRGLLWAMRGLSPGSQDIFCLTEGQRVHYGLRRTDVVPCVTTLRHVPRDIRMLTTCAFKRHFIDAGERCWLINSHKRDRSKALDAYLSSIVKESRDNYTCNARDSWFTFVPHPIPRLLVSSGFTSFGPKVLINSVGAHSVGSVTGIHSQKQMPVRQLQDFLLAIDFEKMVVPHAKTLKKIEVGQLNSVLNAFALKRLGNARHAS